MTRQSLKIVKVLVFVLVNVFDINQFVCIFYLKLNKNLLNNAEYLEKMFIITSHFDLINNCFCDI